MLPLLLMFRRLNRRALQYIRPINQRLYGLDKRVIQLNGVSNNTSWLIFLGNGFGANFFGFHFYMQINKVILNLQLMLCHFPNILWWMPPPFAIATRASVNFVITYCRGWRV